MYINRSELHRRHQQLRNDYNSSEDQDPIDLSPASLLHRTSNNVKLKTILRSRILDKLQRQQQQDSIGMSGIPGANMLEDDTIITPLDLSGR